MADVFQQLDPLLWAVAPIVLLSFTTEAMTGFGSIVIAVTLAATFFPIKQLLPVIVPLNLILSGYIVSRYRTHIDWSILFKWILPWTSIGVAAGMAMFNILDGPVLKRIFGALVVVFAARELYGLTRSIPDNENVDPTPAPGMTSGAIPWLLGSGLTHGLYASGGPLLVYALGRVAMPKAIFRATLSFVWLALNAGMAIGYGVQGRLDAETRLTIALFVPIALLGIILGEFLHHRIDEHRFRLGIFSLLTFAGSALLLA